MKKLLTGLVVLTGVVSLSGCASDNETTIIEVTDRAGREVEILKDFSKITSIAPSVTGMLIDLGVEDLIVAVDQNSYSQFEFGEDVINLGSTFSSINTELVIESESEIVFTSTKFESDAHNEKYVDVEAAGVSVLSTYSGDTLENVKLDVEFIAEVTNTEEKGEEIITEYQEVLDEIKEIAETIDTKKNVYYEVGYYGSESIWTTGANTFQNEMIELVGGVNVFSDLDGFNSISEESIIDKALEIDVIVMPDTGDIDDAVELVSARAGWDVMQAVQNEDVYLVDQNSFSQANHKLTKGLIDLAKALFPTEYAAL